jgi:hypothetical protein
VFPVIVLLIVGVAVPRLFQTLKLDCLYFHLQHQYLPSHPLEMDHPLPLRDQQLLDNWGKRNVAIAGH